MSTQQPWQPPSGTDEPALAQTVPSQPAASPDAALAPTGSETWRTQHVTYGTSQLAGLGLPDRRAGLGVTIAALCLSVPLLMLLPLGCGLLQMLLAGDTDAATAGVLIGFLLAAALVGAEAAVLGRAPKAHEAWRMVAVAAVVPGIAMLGCALPFLGDAERMPGLIGLVLGASAFFIACIAAVLLVLAVPVAVLSFTRGPRERCACPTPAATFPGTPAH